MKKIGKAALAIAGCIAQLTLSANSHAESFEFDPGMGPDPFNPNFAWGDGQPYDWYYQGITLDFGGGYADGRENTSYHDDPSGNIPYFIFDGTDNSSAGHCLQIVFTAATTNISPHPVQDLRFAFVDSLGRDTTITEFDTNNSSSYSIVRLWIQNTGSGLYWHTKIADGDGNSGAWNQAAGMNIWRLDKNQASCMSSGLVSASFIGVSGNYTACWNGSCAPGG